MATMNDAVEREAERIRQLRGAPPPLPVEEGFTPIPFTLGEEQGVKNGWLDGAARALGLLPKGLLQGLSLATEPLRRGDTALRGSVLTAMGRMDLDTYPDFMAKAVKGQVNISGDEFNRLALGQAFSEYADSIPAGPEWLKKLVYPEAYLASKDGKSAELPDFTIGDLLGLGSEVFVSPWAAGAWLPRTALNTTRVGRFAVNVFDAPTNAIVWPLKTAAAAGRAVGLPFDQLILALRPPSGALAKFPELLGDFFRDTDQLTVNLGNQADKLHALGKLHKAVWRDDASQRRIAKHLFESEQKLSPAELALANDIWKEIGSPLLARAREMGYDVIPGTGKKLKWDESRYFRQFIPKLKNYSGRAKIIGEKEFSKRMRVNVPWKPQGETLSHLFPGMTDEHFDLSHGLASLVVAWERKLIFEARTRTAKLTKRRTTTGGLPLFAGQEPEVVETTRQLWAPHGVLAKWRPYRPGAGSPYQNPRLRALKMTHEEENYWYKKVHDLTGNASGKWRIIANERWESFLGNLDAMGATAARKSRIVDYLYRRAKPSEFLPPSMDAVTGTLIAHTAVSTLGLNLASALNNTSQLLNTAAIGGVPAVMRGMVRFMSLGDEGKTLREARRVAQFQAPFRKITHDPTWEAVRGGTPLTDLLMGPFNLTENWVRGIAYHVGLEKALRRRGLSVEQFVKAQRLAQSKGADWIQLGAVLREAKEFAQETNFVYGVAGRSSLMSHPIARIGMTLQSYAIYEAEFLAKLMKRDGGDFARWLALNGWAIDMADKVAGVNAESWMGWGFLPPHTLGRGPQAEMMLNLTKMLFAAGVDDGNAFEEAATQTRGNVRELFRLVGLEDTEIAEGSSTALNAIATLGFLPIPIVGVARTAKAVNEFRTGQREDARGQKFGFVTRQEAVTSWFSTTHKAYADRRLKTMDVALRRQVDKEMDRRAKKFVNALRGKSGDEVWSAARDLASPISLKIPVSAQRGLMETAGFVLGDEKNFWPHPDMVSSRVSRLTTRAIVPRALVEMDEAGWTMDVLWAAYVERAFQELEHGAVRPLQQGGSQ